jgi:hypothetical protein
MTSSWAVKQGVIISPSIKIVFDSYKGYHVVAVQSIPIGTAIITVPLSICSLLHSKKSNYSPVEKVLAPLKLPGLYIQASQLLVLLFSSGGDQLGDHGKILKNLNLDTITLSSLPSEVSNMLKGTTLDDGGAALPVSERFKDIWPCLQGKGLLEKLKITEAQDYFSYCCKLVLSRCVETDGSQESECAPGPQYVPVIDFFNHSVTPQAQIMQIGGKGDFVSLTIAPISAGDEVFISYGEKSDAELLRQYGFVLRPQSLTSAEQTKLTHQKRLFEQHSFNLLSEDALFASVYTTYLNRHNAVFLSAELVENVLQSLYDNDFTIPRIETLTTTSLKSKKSTKNSSSKFKDAQTLCKSSGLYFEGGGFTCVAGNVSYDLILVAEILLRSLLFPRKPLFIPEEASTSPTVAEAALKSSSKKRKLLEVDEKNKEETESVKRLASWDVHDEENLSKTLWLSLFVLFGAKRNESRGRRNEGREISQSAQNFDSFRSQYFSLTDAYVDKKENRHTIINSLWVAMGEEEILIKFMTSINRNLGLGLDHPKFTGLLHKC